MDCLIYHHQEVVNMTQKQMIELVQQHHPNAGEAEIRKLLNKAKDTFCAETEMVKDSWSVATVANQRYYTLEPRVIKITSVWLDEVQISRAIAPPIIDDNTSETG